MLATVFVVLYILAGLGGGYAFRPTAPSDNYAGVGSYFLLWLCVGILGWVTFGGAAAVR